FDEKIGQGRTLEPVSLNIEERRKLFEVDLEFIKEVNLSEISSFVGALYNGIPLALFRFYPNREKLEKIVLKTVEEYERRVKIEKKDKLYVEKDVKFGNDLKVFIFTHLIVSLLEKSNLLSTRKTEVELSEIRNLTSNLFKFDERFKTRIDNDIYHLNKDVEDKSVCDWTAYIKVLEKPVGEPDERNFLAHSGFEKNLVEVKKVKNVYVRYKEEKIGTIKNFCQKGLK
ncbi:MAG: hypothetical protein N3E48_02455, partial [Candidatus Bathyarchaeota archaeon]|nr:hypothetical protein [Candidatus Bathyarchaeota archaeon]